MKKSKSALLYPVVVVVCCAVCVFLFITVGHLLATAFDMSKAAKIDVAQEVSVSLQKNPNAAVSASSSDLVAPSSMRRQAYIPAHGSLDINGTVLEYVDTYEVDEAPVEGAGLWMGSDSTTDNSWGYFIGHNPGPFTCVMDLVPGDSVTVTDSQNESRMYRVIDAFVVSDTTYWEDISNQVSHFGESVILQTCVGDNESYRIVIAA